MNAGAVLYVDAVSACNAVYIRAEHGSEPDAAVVAQLAVASENGIFGQKTVFSPCGSHSFYGFDDCHYCLLKGEWCFVTGKVTSNIRGWQAKRIFLFFVLYGKLSATKNGFRRKSESRCKGIMEWWRHLVGRLELAQEAHVVFREHT